MSDGLILIGEKPDVGIKLASIVGNVMLSNGEELKFSMANDPKYKDLIRNETRKGYLKSKNGTIITFAFGHLFRMKQPVDYVPELKSVWKPEMFPIIPKDMVQAVVKSMYEPSKGKEAQINVILKLFKDAKTIVNCMDADREGQSIFMIPYIMSGSMATVKRLWISDQTEESFKKGLNQLKNNSDYDNIWYAGISRSIADWLVGMNITGVHVAQTRNMVHIGRVKSPTLAIIVKRDLEIMNFKKELHYNLIADYGGFKGELNLETLGIDKIKDKQKAEHLLNEIRNEQTGKIISCDSEEERKLPPQLYNNTTISGDAGDMYGYTMAETLKISQSLYDKGFTSYPRSDNSYLPESLEGDLSTILNNILQLPNYGKFAKPYVKPNNRYINDAKQGGSSHYGIIPTKTKPDFSKLNEDEKKIYDLIIKRFLCMFQDSVVFEKTRVKVNIKGYEFISSGKVIKNKGWLELYPNVNTKDTILPPVKKDDILSIASITVAQKETTPPKSYTTRTLGSVMENVSRLVEDRQAKDILKKVEGIGTPATRASIIQELEDGGYITQKNSTIRSTDKGRFAMQCLEQTGIEVLYSPLMTANWENDLKEIEDGNLNYKTFVKRIVDFVNESTNKIKTLPTNYSNQSLRNGSSTVKTTTSTTSDSSVKKGRAKQGECGFCKESTIKKNEKKYYCQKCFKTVWINGLEYRGIPSIDEKTAYKILAKQKVTLTFKAKVSGAPYEGAVYLSGENKLTVDLVSKTSNK